MPTLTVYHHGLTGGCPPSVNDHERAKRSDCIGWSQSSTRRNTRFLYSVNEKGLTGVGFAVTLTLRECPPSHDDWHRIRTAFYKRLRRMDMVRCHWLTEWQRRGVPHLHSAIWFPIGTDVREIMATAGKVIDHWLEASAEYDSRPLSQTVKPITDSLGWFKYLSKHAARGLYHYQRSSANIPQGWEKTGRMWGTMGEWPTGDEMKITLDQSGWYKFRRMVRGYRKADARADGNPKRIRSARRMLMANKKTTSQVRGVSEWIEPKTYIPMLSHLVESGHLVDQQEEQDAA